MKTYKYLNILFIFLLSIALIGCQDKDGSEIKLLNAPPPNISLSSGTYVGAQTISITTELEDSDIHYTLDGSLPTKESPLYTEPIVVLESLTLKAVVVKTGYNASTVSEAVYTILLDLVGVIEHEDYIAIYFGMDASWVDIHYVMNQTNQQNIRMEKNSITNLFEVMVYGVNSGDSIIYGFTYDSSGVKSYGWSMYLVGDIEIETQDVIFTNTMVGDVNHLKISIGFTEAVNWVNIHYLVNFTSQQNLQLTLNTTNNRYEISIVNFSNSDSLAYSFTYEIGTAATTTIWNTYKI